MATDPAVWHGKRLFGGRLPCLIFVWVAFLVSMALWGVGVANARSFGGLIHLLLVVAVLPALVRVLRNCRPF